MDVLNSNGEAERREKEVGFMVCRPVVFVSLCICQGVDDKSPEWIQVSVVVVVVRVLGQQLKSIYSAKEIFTSHHPRTIIY